MPNAGAKLSELITGARFVGAVGVVGVVGVDGDEGVPPPPLPQPVNTNNEMPIANMVVCFMGAGYEGGLDRGGHTNGRTHYDAREIVGAVLGKRGEGRAYDQHCHVPPLRCASERRRSDVPSRRPPLPSTRASRVRRRQPSRLPRLRTPSRTLPLPR